jgi:hypothetical protein
MLRRTGDPRIRKGRDVPLPSLVEQASVSLELARKHADRLAHSGWSATHTGDLAARREALRDAIGARHDHRNTAKAATEYEADARRDAMRFLRHLRNALPLALRKTSEQVTAASFRVPAPLGRSTPKIVGYLSGISGLVARLDADLAPFFDGARASERLRVVVDALSKKDVTQEILRSGKLEHTDRVHRLAGEVLQDIEDLHRIARIAFDEEPQTRKAFSKYVIARATRPRKKAAPEVTPTATSDEASAG